MLYESRAIRANRLAILPSPDIPERNFSRGTDISRRFYLVALSGTIDAGLSLPDENQITLTAYDPNVNNQLDGARVFYVDSLSGGSSPPITKSNAATSATPVARV